MEIDWLVKSIDGMRIYRRSLCTHVGDGEAGQLVHIKQWRQDREQTGQRGRAAWAEKQKDTQSRKLGHCVYGQ